MAPALVTDLEHSSGFWWYFKTGTGTALLFVFSFAAIEWPLRWTLNKSCCHFPGLPAPDFPAPRLITVETNLTRADDPKRIVLLRKFDPQAQRADKTGRASFGFYSFLFCQAYLCHAMVLLILSTKIYAICKLFELAGKGYAHWQAPLPIPDLLKLSAILHPSCLSRHPIANVVRVNSQNGTGSHIFISTYGFRNTLKEYCSSEAQVDFWHWETLCWANMNAIIP